MPTWPGLAVRIPAIAIAAYAVVWAVDAIETRPPEGLYATAEAVRRGESLPRDVLLGVAGRVDEHDCGVETRESVLAIRMSLVTSTSPGRTLQHDADVAGLREEAHRTLACSPANGLAWLTLFLATSRSDGLSPYALGALAESFRTAPHEAWLQLIRLPLLLPVVEALPAPLEASAMRDYADILEDGLDSVAATLIVRAAPSLRTRLLDAVCGLSLPRRKTLVTTLSRLQPSRLLTHACLPDTSKPAFMK